MSDFVHLHLHSEYSLLDGACRIREIPRAVREAGQNAVALTDHGVMYGAVAFHKACVEENVKPILGCEVYVAPRSIHDRVHTIDGESEHLVLLVRDAEGYQNLIRLVSLGFTDGFYGKPRVDDELLAAHSGGLIALSACMSGRIPRLIQNGDRAGALACAQNYARIFGENNFYIELQDQGVAGQKLLNASLCDLARQAGLPLVATNDVHYLKKQDAEAQAALTCIQTGNLLSEGNPLGFATDEYYLKNEDEMRERFSQVPEALSHTSDIASRCDFSFPAHKTFLPAYMPPDGKSPKDYLRELAKQGLEQRVQKQDIVYDDKHSADDYKMRIEYELMVISSMGYDAYFLIVSDFVRYAKSHGIPTGPGRGSGAGSLIAYLIYITEVDPIRFGLLFESFLNPKRITMPDFDIDFCDKRREEVIQYVTERYGSDHVSQIITFGTLAPRAAVRDVGRALGMAYGDVDAVAKAIPQRPGITLREAMEEEELKKLAESNADVKRLLSIASAVEGMPRHASTHAAGVVITDRPLVEHVPLAVNNTGVVTQYDMDTIASLGLLKFDFLGLRYLTVIDETCRSIRKRDPSFNLEKVPTDDPETYAMITNGRCDGVFQLESAGIRSLLSQFRPEALEDIMIAIAFYRPGPMEAIPRFLKNRREPGGISYCLPEMADILDETSGCIVYQEQVMQIFRTVAGYSYGKADIVRRAIAKKKAGVIEQERETFIEGASKKGVSREDAETLFSEMTAFSGYGFKKSHAAAYALLSFRTAYLRAHYPSDYFAALISSVLGQMPKMSAYIASAARMGIRMLPPDINQSSAEFTVEGSNIRFGLLAVKNVGEQFIGRILAERQKKPFESFYDFISRLASGELNKSMIETLIRVGAFDRLGVCRSRLLAVYKELIASFQQSGRSRVAGQLDLLGGDDGGFSYPELAELPGRERLMNEKELTGMYLSGHLLDDYQEALSILSPVSLSDLRAAFDTSEEEESAPAPDSELADKKTITVAGILTGRQDKTTKNGDSMAFLTLEDRYAEVEILVFPKSLPSCLPYLTIGNALAITGEISVREKEAPKLLLRSLMPLSSVTNKKTETASISPTAVSRTAPVPASPAPSAASAPVSEAPAQGAYPEAYMRFLKPDAPAPAVQEPAKPKTLYLRVPDMEGWPFRQAMALLQIFPGSCPAVLFNRSTGKYLKTNLNADLTPFLYEELKKVLGNENVVLK